MIWRLSVPPGLATGIDEPGPGSAGVGRGREMKFLDSGFAVTWRGMRLLGRRHTRFAILPAS